MRRASNTILPVVVLLASGAGSAHGQRTLHVDTHAVTPVHNGMIWCTAFLTLDDALAVAEPGDTVRIADGLYTPDPSGLSDPRDATFQMQSGVRIEGGYAGFAAPNPDERDVDRFQTILSGDLTGDDGPAGRDASDNCYHVIRASGTDSTAFLDGVTVKAGNADGAGDRSAGGGLYNAGGHPTIAQCVFRGNRASLTGGGMYHSQGSTADVSFCLFEGNRTEHGGGMYCTGSSPTLSDCVFLANHVGDTGGGLCNWEGAHPTLTRCTFVENTTDDWGGGLCNRYGSHPELTGCRFERNVGTFGGGMANWDSLATLTGCVFVDNVAHVSGGGLLNHASAPTLTHCVFRGNRAAYYGGAVFNNDRSDPAFFNCLLVENHAGSGGALRNTYSHASLSYCTLAENQAATGRAVAFDSFHQAYPGGVEMDHCIVWEGGSEFWNNDGSLITITWSDVFGGGDHPTNIESDPRFVPGPVGSYYLAQTAAGHQQQSPCVDAGAVSAEDAQLADRTTRWDEVVDAGTVDLGYHHPVTGRPLVFGDADRDGRIDLSDFASLQACFSGSGPLELPPRCRIFDDEPDDDLDLIDFQLLHLDFAGP